MKKLLKTQCLLVAGILAVQSSAALAQEVSTDYSTYDSGEEIIVTFSEGPGNPKDWVGLYPVSRRCSGYSRGCFVDASAIVCSAVGRRIRGIIRFICLFSGGEKNTGYNNKVYIKLIYSLKHI